MDNFDICMLIAFIIIIFITTYTIVVIKYNHKIDKKIKTILSESESEELTIQSNQILIKEPNQPDKQLEPFIVADAQDIHNYDAIRADVKKLSDNFDDDTIKNPPINKIVNYNYPTNGKDTKAYITNVDFGQDKPYPVVSCSNSSITNSLTTGPMQLLPSQLECSLPNKLTAENYYKTHYNARSIPMDDYAVRGANYMDYSDTPNPYANTRILSQNTKGLIPSATAYKNIPTGSNYAFYNTPAMPEMKYYNTPTLPLP